jgi:hypothetical protein
MHLNGQSSLLGVRMLILVGSGLGENVGFEPQEAMHYNSCSVTETAIGTNANYRDNMKRNL